MCLFNKLTSLLVKIETKATVFLVAMIVLLIVVNIITRAAGNAIYWVDEMVIYLMVWMVFMSLPLLIHLRKNIAVNIVSSFLKGRIKSAFEIFSEVVVLCLSIFMLYLSCLWFNPLDLMMNGFDFELFAGNTFNYIYHEPTNTLSVDKYLVWLIMPLSALLCSIHAFTNIFELLKSEKQVCDELPVEENV